VVRMIVPKHRANSAIAVRIFCFIGDLLHKKRTKVKSKTVSDRKRRAWSKRRPQKGAIAHPSLFPQRSRLHPNVSNTFQYWEPG
jgi:hypothetical protein